MKIIEINAVERINEMLPLLEVHADELATQRKLMVVKPDMVKYEYLQNTGGLASLGLFDEKDMLVGYSVNIISNFLHYSELPVAQNDVLFVRKDLRGGRWGLKLIKETEKLCKERMKGKTFIMMMHAKPGTALHSIMPKLEYGVQDIMFSKVL